MKLHYICDLTDRYPLEWSVTVPYGYNVTHLREEGIKIKKELQIKLMKGIDRYGWFFFYVKLVNS